MAKRKSTKATAAMNVSLPRRLAFAYGAATEIEPLTEHIRDALSLMGTSDSLAEEAVIFALLDRAKIIADALLDAASPSEDEHHTDEKFAYIFRFVPGAEAANG